ncbi:hypothetical protein M1P97_08445 [Parabacteroides sp. GYB001]|uniref:hypothetical protein n=1 Tax=Parabacteroides leei TaxID=2939491 RepID=UPI0020173A9D|nr:hypothetical protein [Parabacteroides leei]MCL3851313.1 hypothetical protein [Parabacteroides leei]
MTHSIFSYLNVQVSRKPEAGKESTADLYRAVQNRLYRFAAGCYDRVGVAYYRKRLSILLFDSLFL